VGVGKSAAAERTIVAGIVYSPRPHNALVDRIRTAIPT